MFRGGPSEDQTGTTCDHDESSSVVKTLPHLSYGLRRTTVIVCLLVNYPRCVTLAWAENKCRVVARVFSGSERGGGEGKEESGREWGRLKCFQSLCAPRVTKSTTDAGPDKSRQGRAPLFFSSSSSEVVTLTFPLAYVIPRPKPPPPPPPPLNLSSLSLC